MMGVRGAKHPGRTQKKTSIVYFSGSETLSLKDILARAHAGPGGAPKLNYLNAHSYGHPPHIIFVRYHTLGSVLQKQSAG